MYNQIMNDYEPELIMLVGSRNMGVANLKSDYDIVIYTLQHNIKYRNCPLRTRYNDCTVHGYVINIENYLRNFQYNLEAMDSLFIWFDVTTVTLNSNIIYKTDKGTLLYDYISTYRKDLIGVGIESICRALSIDLKNIYEHNQYFAYDNKRFFHLLMAYQVLCPAEDVVYLIKKIRMVGSSLLSESDKEKLVYIAKYLYEY